MPVDVTDAAASVGDWAAPHLRARLPLVEPGCLTWRASPLMSWQSSRDGNGPNFFLFYLGAWVSPSPMDDTRCSLEVFGHPKGYFYAGALAETCGFLSFLFILDCC